MKIFSEKFFGWILLATGLVIIGWSLFSAFNVFSGNGQAPQIFAEQKIAENAQNAKAGAKAEANDMQSVVEGMIGEQLQNMVPSDTLPRLLNLTVYSMLVFLLFSGGGKISEIGIKLMKS